ncbi:MAG: sulfatase-like hydrolase/transferase [Acidobacteriota bacterium]|nr:sulfatase-like hydrolase/transferase [Acidobacteriota bacterium]
MSGHSFGGAFFACLLIAAAGFLACQGADHLAPPDPAATQGPILLITVDALRADAVGALAETGTSGPVAAGLDLTPHLDALVAEADWAGTAIASSSASIPATAGLLTGLTPWLHQALHPEQPRLSSAVTTLAEALRERGYTTTAYVSGHWYPQGLGYEQGFDYYRGLNRGGKAAGHLASLEPGPSFFWIHVDAPSPPLRIRDRLRPQLGPLPDDLPKELSALQLELYRSPRVQLSEDWRQRILALYRGEVALLDLRVQRLLRGLRESGQWDRSLVAVVSAHGEEIGEHGQMGHANNLMPESLRVPMILKLPKGSPHTLRLQPGEPVAATRLWATLVEHAGGMPGPSVAPSLFHQAPPGVLSELYLSDGANRFSWLQGDLQLLRTVRFAREPDFYRARRALAGGRLQRPLAEPAAELLDRVYRTFLVTPPFSGGSESTVRQRLLRWGPEGVEAVPDEAARNALAAELERRWRSFQESEQPPEQVLRQRSLASPPAP